MHIYECIVKTGHMGAGSSLEKSIRVKARDMVDAMRRAKRMPGVKKGFLKFSGASVMKISLVQ